MSEKRQRRKSDELKRRKSPQKSEECVPDLSMVSTGRKRRSSRSRSPTRSRSRQSSSSSSSSSRSRSPSRSRSSSPIRPSSSPQNPPPQRKKKSTVLFNSAVKYMFRNFSDEQEVKHSFTKKSVMLFDDITKRIIKKVAEDSKYYLKKDAVRINTEIVRSVILSLDDFGRHTELITEIIEPSICDYGQEKYTFFKKGTVNRYLKSLTDKQITKDALMYLCRAIYEIEYKLVQNLSKFSRERSNTRIKHTDLLMETYNQSFFNKTVMKNLGYKCNHLTDKGTIHNTKIKQTLKMNLGEDVRISDKAVKLLKTHLDCMFYDVLVDASDNTDFLNKKTIGLKELDYVVQNDCTRKGLLANDRYKMDFLDQEELEYSYQ